MKFILTFIALSVLVNGCSTLSKEECQHKDWFSTGFSDSMRGITQPKISKYQAQCSEHGVKIESSKYLKGYESGLESYCTRSNGELAGSQGRGAHLRCEQINPEYQMGYSLGLEKYKAKKELRDKEKERKKLEANLISRYGTQKCSADWDCDREGTCSGNKCLRSGLQCTFNSDCKIRGRCSTVSDTTSSGEWVQARVCAPY